MRLLLPMVWLLPLLFGCASGGKRLTDADRTAIYRLLERQQSAWNDGDLEGYLDAYHRGADLVGVERGRVQLGYLNFRSGFRRDVSSLGSGRISLHDLEIRETGPDTALALGRWHLEGSSAGDGEILFTLLARRFEEGVRKLFDDILAHHRERVLAERLLLRAPHASLRAPGRPQAGTPST